jgi:hypothetical protein
LKDEQPLVSNVQVVLQKKKVGARDCLNVWMRNTFHCYIPYRTYLSMLNMYPDVSLVPQDKG